MKSIKIIITLVLFSITTNTNAQFFKKLKEKAQQKVKHEAERRAQRRVDKKIDKAFDETENEIDKTVAKKPKKSRTVFNFTHVYVLKMTDYKGKVINFEYYLKNNVNYLAVSLPDMKNNMTSIMDLEDGKNISLMENNGQKSRMTLKFNFKKTAEDNYDGLQIKTTGNKKTILNYTCYEYEVKDKNLTSLVWVAEDTGISFPKDFQGNAGKKMKNQNNNWMFKMGGIVLEMTVTDTSRKKPRISKMICTKLEKKDTNIDISLYKKLL